MQKTRKSMVYTGLTILACIAMLVAATFAWFTDSVTNTGNKIKAGELKISATAAPTGEDGLTVTIPGVNDSKEITFSKDAQNLKADSNPIITEENFEPGKSNAKLLTVTNAGTLNTKIKLNFNITNDELTDALWFDFVQVNKDGSLNGKFEKRPMNTLATFAEKMEFKLAPEADLQFVLVYGMDETAGNAFGGKAFGADVSILATQAVGEQDGFGHDDYDKDADYAVDVTSDAEFEQALEGLNNPLAGKTVNIRLTDNIDNAAGAQIAAGNTLNIDFAGNTMTVGHAVGSPGTVSNGMQILANATVTLRNGTFAPANTGVLILLQHYGNLTLDNMTLDTKEWSACYPVLSCNNGTVHITGNTNITAASGKTALDVMYWADSYPNGVKVEIDENMTGTIDGQIDVYKYNADGSMDFDNPEKAELVIKGGTYKNTGLTLEQFKKFVPEGYQAAEIASGVYQVTKS